MKLFKAKSKSTTVSISNETILRTISIIVILVLSVRIIGQLSHVLTLLGVSLFLAIALNPAVTRISRALNIKSRALATGLAYIFVLALLSLFLSLVLPPLVHQTTDFIKQIPQTISDFRTGDSSLSKTIHHYKLDGQLENISHEISSRVNNLPGPVLSTAGKIGSTIVAFLTVLVMTFMLLVEGPEWLERMWSMQAVDARARRKQVVHRMYRVVTSYVNGQVFIAAVAATFATVALFIGSSIAHVSVNPVALAGIVFVFGLIPLIGNTLAATIVILFCFFQSPGLAIGMTIYFLVYQQTENATLQPYIQSRSNNLTPLIVFVSALIGATLGGLLGALAAIPVAGCIRVLFDEYLVERLVIADEDDEKKVVV